MLDKILAFLSPATSLVPKAFGVVHAAFDTVTAHITAIKSPYTLAGVVLVIAVVADLVWIGHLGVVNYLIATVKDLADLFIKGGWPLVAGAVVAFLIYDKMKKSA